jgi:hypothetical protein
MEAFTLCKVNRNKVISFLDKNNINRFSVPNSLVFDNASYFSSLKLTKYALEKRIKIKYSSNCYPQGNGVVESSNKNLIRIFLRTIIENQKNWHNALSNALWTDTVTPKVTLGNSPYFLVYRHEDILPSNFFLPSLQLAQSARGPLSTALQRGINALLKLEKERNNVQIKF